MSRSIALARMFGPKSIAVVGASDQEGNLGAVAMGHLRRLGFPGTVHPVNPSRPSVAGVPCYPDIASVPGPVDLAILAVRARAIPDLVRACAAAGVAGGVVWAGGFAEAGEDGAALQDELATACRQTGFVLLGPNCLGFIDSRTRTIASFASFLGDIDTLASGPISMVSQSGGLATQAQALAQRAGSGFRYMVSTGNEADLTVADVIDLFADDDSTTVIAAYIEGVRDGPRLIAALEHARRAGRPVVLLKGGVAPAGARAATAHTGALAGADRVLSAVLRELGVVRVGSLEELLDTALLLASLRPSAGSDGTGLGIVTFGGGGGVLAADQAAAAGLSTPSLAPATQDALRPLLPPIASLENPVDVTPATFNQPNFLAQFPQALVTLAADAGVGAVLALFGPMRVGVAEVVDALVELRAAADCPVILAWPFCLPATSELLQQQGFYVFSESARAIAAWGRIAAARSAARDAPDHTRPPQAGPSVDWGRFVPDPRPGLVVSERACHELLTAAGLPVAAGRLVRAGDDLAAALRAVGLPVVMKGNSELVLHRDAVGLVHVDVRTTAEARDVYDRLLDRAADLGITLDGVYLQRLAASGAELLVSAFRDPVFGVMISVGAGGTLTEAIDDMALARAPIGPSEAEDLLRRLRIVRYRERTGKSRGLRAVASFVADLSSLAESAPWAEFVLEVNPVRWTDEGPVAVDGLLIVERP